MQTLKFIGKYVLRHWWQYVLGILALYMVDQVNVYVPEYTGKIIDGLTGALAAPESATFTLQSAMSIVWVILGMGIAIAVGRFCWRFFIFGAARSIEREMRQDMYGHLSTLSIRYYNQHKTGDLMAHFTNDLMSVRQLLGMTVITAFDATVMMVLVLWQMVTSIDPRLTAVAIIPLLVICVGDFFYGRMMHKRFREKQAAFSTLSDQVQETISGIRVIKAFVQERKELYAFARTAEATKEKNLNVVRLHALVMPLIEVIIGLSTLATLIYGGYLTIHGEITVGEFVAFNSYVTMLVWPMMAVGECITHVSQGTASLGRIHDIFQQKADIVDDAMTDHTITALTGELQLNGLTFAYPGHEETPVLKDITFTIKPGETLAIIGRTGTGKTTIPSLLTRLYDVPVPAMITFGGRSIREIPLSVLREGIACVPQDNFLFSDSIHNNIAFGSHDKTAESVIHAAQLACIHENIAAFPEAYETVVGERGVTLSGGQKQRSSIARALMKDAPVLILDDALSAVDTDTERSILDNLRTVRGNERITIIIAHRISTIQDADHILVLEEAGDGQPGSIMAEYGTHEELMQRGGIYRSIFDKQQLEKQLREDNVTEGGEAHV